MQHNQPYLRITDLSRHFGTFAALRGVSIDILEGELICFLGPSGCGKTTLLRTLAGLELQTGGSILRNGTDISRLPPGRRNFGIVFQSYALFPNLSVRSNIGYGLHGAGRSRADIERRIDELLRSMELRDQADKYPAQLSGGQQQRVAIARALAVSPGALLLDEPLSALDAQVRVRLRRELKALQRRFRITTIMVTHDQEEALALADRIVVMNAGLIEQVGTPFDIYARPKSLFVANFIGETCVLPGVVARANKVLIGDTELAYAPIAADLGVGAAVLVCIRPEDVVVHNVAHDTENSLLVTIKELEFLGSWYRLSVGFGARGGGELSAQCSSNVVRDLAITRGDTIRIAIPAARVRVFPRSESHPVP
jgi:iron(III) transport system ATP-binding protein